MSKCYGCNCYDAEGLGDGFIAVFLIWLFSPVIGVIGSFLADGGIQIILIVIAMLGFLWATDKIYKIVWGAFIRRAVKKHKVNPDDAWFSLYDVHKDVKSKNDEKQNK